VKFPITFRPFNSGGKGGQHGNRSMNAIEASVTLHDGRVIKGTSKTHKSQHRNKEAAKKILLAKVKEALQPERIRPDLARRVRSYHAVRNEVIDHASGMKRRYDRVLEGGQAFEDLVNARREACEAQLDLDSFNLH